MQHPVTWAFTSGRRGFVVEAVCVWRTKHQCYEEKGSVHTPTQITSAVDTRKNPPPGKTLEMCSFASGSVSFLHTAAGG